MPGAEQYNDITRKWLDIIALGRYASTFFAPAPLWNTPCLHSIRRTESKAHALFSSRKSGASRRTRKQIISSGDIAEISSSEPSTFPRLVPFHCGGYNHDIRFRLWPQRLFVESAAECDSQRATRHSLRPARSDATIHGDSHGHQFERCELERQRHRGRKLQHRYSFVLGTVHGAAIFAFAVERHRYGHQPSGAVGQRLGECATSERDRRQHRAQFRKRRARHVREFQRDGDWGWCFERRS